MCSCPQEAESFAVNMQGTCCAELHMQTGCLCSCKKTAPAIKIVLALVKASGLM